MKGTLFLFHSILHIHSGHVFLFALYALNEANELRNHKEACKYVQIYRRQEKERNATMTTEA